MRRIREEEVVQEVKHWSEWELTLPGKAFSYKAYVSQKCNDFRELLEFVEKNLVDVQKKVSGFFNPIATSECLSTMFYYFYTEEDVCVEDGKEVVIKYPKIEKVRLYFFQGFMVTKAKRIVIEHITTLLRNKIDVNIYPRKFIQEGLLDIAEAATFLNTVKFANVPDSEIENLTAKGYFDRYIPRILEESNVPSASLKSFEGVYETDFGNLKLGFNSNGTIKIKRGKGKCITAEIVNWTLNFHRGAGRTVTWKTEQETEE